MKRHLIRKHGDQPEVKEALSKDLTKKASAELFQRILSKGILKTNLEEVGKENPNFESARRSKNQKDKLVMCANCKIFLKSKSMARNAKICALPKESIQVKMIAKPTVKTSDEFKTHVLALLRNIT